MPPKHILPWILELPLVLAVVLAGAGCANVKRDYDVYSGLGNDKAPGPWDKIGGFALSEEDVTYYKVHGLLPVKALEEIGAALLALDGATICDPATAKPIKNASAEYCIALYLANVSESSQHSSYELRVTRPRRKLSNAEDGCIPPRFAEDVDVEAQHVTGNQVTGMPPIIGGTAIIVQSYVFTQRADKSIVMALIRSTGDVHIWDGKEWAWRSKCRLDASDNMPAACEPVLQFLTR